MEVPVKVSVIVPVFNTVNYLPECLDSLLNQSLSVEIICVDNGSTDGSLKILKRYSEVHDNIVVIEHPDGRQGDARNAGLEIAKGQYIGFVDSDDFIDPDLFLKLYELSLEHGAEIAICNIDYFFQKSGEFRKNLQEGTLACDEKYRLLDRPVLLRNLTICNKLISANLISRLCLRFPLGFFYEDLYFVVKALINAKSIISTPESLYFYRKERIGAVTQGVGKSVFDVFKIMEMIKNEMGGSHELVHLFYVIKISRLLELYISLRGQIRKDYFCRQKIEFERLPPLAKRSLLTPTEYREFCFLRRNPYWSCELFYSLRRLYGAMRK